MIKKSLKNLVRHYFEVIACLCILVFLNYPWTDDIRLYKKTVLYLLQHPVVVETIVVSVGFLVCAEVPLQQI
jgi:hypothetical protein